MRENVSPCTEKVTRVVGGSVERGGAVKEEGNRQAGEWTIASMMAGESDCKVMLMLTRLTYGGGHR